MDPYRNANRRIDTSAVNAPFVHSPRRAQLPPHHLDNYPRFEDPPMNGVEDRLNYSQSQHRRLQQEIEGLRKKYDHLSTFKNLQLQLNENVRGNQIQSFKKQNYAQIDTMNSEINMLKGVLDMRQNQIDDLRNRNINLENDNQTLRDSQFRLKDLQNKTAAILDQLNHRSNQCDRLNNRVADLDINIKDSNQQNIKLRDILHSRTNDNANLQAKMAQFQFDVNNMRRLQLLDKENQGNLLSNIDQLERKIHHNESYLDNLKKMNHVQFEKYRAHCERLKNTLSDKEKECVDLKDQGNQLMQNLDIYRSKQDELLHQLNDLRNRFDAYRNDKQSQIHALQDQIGGFKNQVAGRQRELLNLNDRLAKGQARINQILVENAELMKVLENLKIKRAEMQKTHANEFQMREAKFRSDTRMMQQNLQEAVQRYQSQIQDQKRIIQRKDSQIHNIQQQFYNQSEANQTLLRREDALMCELNQAKLRLEQSDRQKDYQIAHKEEKFAHQSNTIKNIHGAQFESLKEQGRQLHSLIKNKTDANDSLAQQNSHLLQNYHAIKSSEVKLVNQSQHLKGRIHNIDYRKNKQRYNHEQVRRSQLGAMSRQQKDEVQHLQQQIMGLQRVLHDREAQVQQWKRKCGSIRQGPHYA